MKKSILNLGKTLNKNVQKSINGGSFGCPDVFCTTDADCTHTPEGSCTPVGLCIYRC